MSGQVTGYEVLERVPLWAWLLLAVLLIGQATWIFNDARRRAYNAWVWGAFGLLNFPSSLIIYLLVVNAREQDEVRRPEIRPRDNLETARSEIK